MNYELSSNVAKVVTGRRKDAVELCFNILQGFGAKSINTRNLRAPWQTSCSHLDTDLNARRRHY